jgi:CheY-like chemotaxis protein
MPVLGGIEATQKILAFEEKNRLPHIPIVALTANALSGDREKYIDAGMDNYLSKPIDLERLNILLQEYFPEAVQAAKSDDEAHQSKSETIEKKNESKIYKPEQQEVEVEERDQKEEKTPVIKKDILIFHSLALIANLYERMLSNLGYSVEKVMDEQEFMDRLENSDEIYRFVIFQGRPFKNVKCLISDLVRSTGAEPFVILPRDESAANYCCRSLEEGSDIAVVREKLAHG